MEKDFKRERLILIFGFFKNELQLIILYLGLSQYYAEPLIHGRVDLELDLDNECRGNSQGHRQPPL